MKAAERRKLEKKGYREIWVKVGDHYVDTMVETVPGHVSYLAIPKDFYLGTALQAAFETNHYFKSTGGG